MTCAVVLLDFLYFLLLSATQLAIVTHNKNLTSMCLQASRLAGSLAGRGGGSAEGKHEL